MKIKRNILQQNQIVVKCFVLVTQNLCIFIFKILFCFCFFLLSLCSIKKLFYFIYFSFVTVYVQFLIF